MPVIEVFGPRKMLNQPKVGYSVVRLDFPFDLAGRGPSTDLRIKSYAHFTKSLFFTRSRASENMVAHSSILGHPSNLLMEFRLL